MQGAPPTPLTLGKWVSSSPNVLVFGLWEAVGAPGDVHTVRTCKVYKGFELVTFTLWYHPPTTSPWILKSLSVFLCSRPSFHTFLIWKWIKKIEPTFGMNQKRNNIKCLSKSILHVVLLLSIKLRKGNKIKIHIFSHSLLWTSVANSNTFFLRCQEISASVCALKCPVQRLDG